MEINIAEVIAQAIAFLAVFAILRWKAWGPIQKALQTRRDLIKQQFDHIESSKREIEQIKSEYHAHMQKIDEEARQKLQEAVDQGKNIAREIQENARREGRDALEKAKENIELEIQKAKVTLRNEIVDLTLAATEQLVKEKLNETKDKEMVLDFIEDLEKLK